VKKSILLLSEIFPPKHGGSGRWFWEMYRRLPAGSVRVLTHDWPGSREFDGTHDLPVHRLPIRFEHWGVLKPKGLAQHWCARRAVRRIVKEHQPERIHCGRCIPEGFVAWLLRKFGGPPYWCYAHGEELVYASESRELGWMARRALHGAERVIANSQTTAAILRDTWQVSESKVVVLHPGVEADKFRPAPRSAAVRERLGWGNRPVMLTVGALSARKGQDTMIRALPAIRRVVPDVLYALAGEGWERPRLEELAQRLGVADAVQFRGTPTDSDLVECYQQCDLFALPNRREGNDVEGFGIVLLEAQACGKPVIAGASGGTAETMRVPETGIVVDCTKPERLAETTIEWLLDPVRREMMGRAAREWVVEHFDWTVLVDKARTLFGFGDESTRDCRSPLGDNTKVPC
jgi:phosphatidylinositol alpha-1,6-mannosyltransferase